MEFAIQTRGSYGRVLEAARWVEERGLGAFAVPDHYLAGRAPGGGYDTKSSDVFAYLGGLARETMTVEIVLLVAPVSYRHPATLLKMGLALDEMSGGRFSLGVGAGWFEAEHTIYGLHLADTDERFDRLEEALGYLQSALAPEPTEFKGTYFSLEAAEQKPLPTNLRIVVGGSGPVRTPALAGRFADEFNIYSNTPEKLQVRIDRAREVAGQSGRDPDEILISSAAPPIMGASAEEYSRRLAAFAEARSFDAIKMEENFRDIGVPMGTHQEAQEAFGPLANLGVGRYYVQLLGGLDLDYAAEVVEVLGNA